MRALILALLLAGCASDGMIPVGEKTVGPAGWDQYCAEHAKREECR